MPHDRNGKPLSVGDKVIVRATIKSIAPNEDYCNVTLDTDETMFPGDYKSGLSLNAKQVEKVMEQ